jgi:hypothetical protein
MTRNRIVALLVFSLFLFGSTRATCQTAYGPGGLFIHPSAFIRKPGSTSLNVSWFEQKARKARHNSWLPISLAHGLNDRTEVGVLYVHRFDNKNVESSGGVFAKYQLMPDSDHSPAIAIAGSYLGGGMQLSSASLVASHKFGPKDDWRGLIGHVGVQWARRADAARTRDDADPFIGLEAPLSPRVSLVGEFGTRFVFDYKERSSIGLVYRGDNGYQIGVGAVNIGRSSRNDFFIGVGFPLGGNR